MKTLFAIGCCLLFSVSILAQRTAQKINHLTVEEDELVRDAQELDKRIEIYVKAIDRRFLVLNPSSASQTTEIKESKKEKKKVTENWGALPTGDRAELLKDVESLLDEATNKIDDAAERDRKNVLLPKALKTLAAGCARFAIQLKPFGDKAAAEVERAAVYNAANTCTAVQEAVASNNSSNQ